MSEITVELTEAEVSTLSHCANRRGIDSVNAYVEILLIQFIAYADSYGSNREVDEDVEAKLEDLGYL